MERDPTGGGFTHLGKDGVLRTISGNYEVLDARGLSPEQINAFLDVMPDDARGKSRLSRCGWYNGDKPGRTLSSRARNSTDETRG